MACCGRLGASMRRRDYVMLSTKLGEARKVTQQQAGAECDEMRGYDWAIADLAQVLLADNAAFDMSRFLKDCGVQPND